MAGEVGEGVKEVMGSGRGWGERRGEGRERKKKKRETKGQVDD